MSKPLRLATGSNAPSCFRRSRQAPRRKPSACPPVCLRPRCPAARLPGKGALSFVPTPRALASPTSNWISLAASAASITPTCNSISAWRRTGAAPRSPSWQKWQMLTVLMDQTLLELTRRTQRNQSDSYELTRKMFERGTATELTLRQAESTVDTARANSAQYARALAQDRDALQLLLGAPIPEGIDFSAGLDRPDVVSEVEEAIPSDVLVKRPDVLAAERLLEASNADIGAARAAFFPAIELTGSLGSASTELSGLFKHGSLAWTFAPQVSVPLFSGGANTANLRAVKLTRDIAVAQYEKAIQVAFREVADALAARGYLDEQLAAQQALVSASQDAYHLAQMRFRGGIDIYLSELDAQRSVYEAQQQVQIVRLQRFENLVTIYKTLGGGLHENTVSSTPVLSLV